LGGSESSVSSPLKLHSNYRSGWGSTSLRQCKATVFLFISLTQEKLNQKEENNLVFFCQNFGILGQNRSALTMESSHMPELLRVTSRGMSHTLSKYVSWQEQKIFRDLSPGTIASVTHLQFSRLHVSALTSTSFQTAHHTCTSTWENHTDEFTQQHNDFGRAPKVILMVKCNFFGMQMNILLSIFTQQI
jgi:hypothetical protein